MKFFILKNNLYFLGLIILAPHAVAMEPTLETFCQLQIQCGLQQKLLRDKQFEADIAQAKQLIEQEKGCISSWAMRYLQPALVAGHPVARYLSGEKKASVECQQYRLVKATQELFILISEQAALNNAPLKGKTSVYELFHEILHHPVDRQYDDHVIRAEAEYCLGYMDLHKLGVPREEANFECARQHFTNAFTLGHQFTQQELTWINFYNAIKSESQSTTNVSPTVQKAIEEKTQPSTSEPSTALQSSTQLLEPQQPQPTASQLLIKLTKKSGIPSTLGKTQQQTPVTTAQAVAVSAPSKAQSQVLESTLSATSVKEHAKPEKVQQKQEHKKVKKPKKTEPALDHLKQPAEEFTIAEDTSIHVQECPLEGDPNSLSAKSKKPSSGTTQKKKVMPTQKPKKQKTASVSTSKAREKQPETVDQKEKSAPKADTGKKEKKEKSKQEKKLKKIEKRKAEDAAKSDIENQKKECKQAYALVTNLINHYLEKSYITAIVTELTMQSFEWKTAQETYQETLKFLICKFKQDKKDYPILIGILRFLASTTPEKEATQIISLFDNPVGPSDNWWKARILLACKPETVTEENEKLIIEALSKAFTIFIDKYPKYREVFVRDDRLIDFIRKRADTDLTASVIFVKMGILFGFGEIGLNPEAAEGYLEFAHKCNSVDASLCLGQMYTYGIGVEQSLPEALTILRQMIEFDNEVDGLSNCLIKDLNKITTQQKDFAARLNAFYLTILKQAKDYDKIEEADKNKTIVENLEETEGVFKKMPQQQQGLAAKLFKESGVYETVLPIAQKDPGILAALYKIAKERVENFKLPAEDYAQIFMMKLTQEEEQLHAKSTGNC